MFAYKSAHGLETGRERSIDTFTSLADRVGCTGTLNCVSGRRKFRPVLAGTLKSMFK